MKRITVILSIVLTLLFLTTAAAKAANKAAGSPPVIGVLPFECSVQGMQIGDIQINGKDMASDYLIEHLLNFGKVDIVDQTALVKILDEQGLALAGIVHQSEKIAACAKLLPVEYLVVGRITGIGPKGSWVQYDDAKHGGGAQSHAIVAALMAKIVQVSDGDTILTFSSRGISSSVGYDARVKNLKLHLGSHEIAMESVSNAIDKAAKELAQKISDAA